MGRLDVCKLFFKNGIFVNHYIRNTNIKGEDGMQLGKQYSIYFFDFYGTIMHRKCSGNDIKKIWSNQLALQFGNKLNSKEWYKLRKAAEQYVCKKENHFEFTY